MKNLLSTFSSFITRRFSRPERWCMAFSLVLLVMVLGVAYGDHLIHLTHDALAATNNVTGNTPAAASTTGSSSPVSDSVGALGQQAGQIVSGLATLFIKLIGGILYFVLKWMGPLMDNTFILDGDIGEKLRSVWVIIRNFVNIFFALALVIVALMSVVGYGDEGGNYALKKFIPKMALALIAVNFTFLACRIVLDINNVLTTAIFAIPQSVTTVGDIGPSGTAGKTIFKKFRCFEDKKINDEVKRAQDLEKKYNGTISSLGGVCFAQDPGSETYETLISSNNVTNKDKQAIISLDQSSYTKKDFVWVMATQFQGIHDLNKVSVLLDPTFSGLTVNALFSVVFAVIYATAYISMFIILIARMAVLWITIMLSPLVAIQIVFPDIKFDDFDIKEKFLTHAFVPAKMALPLALGYIMLSQMTLAVDSSSGVFADQVIDIASGGEFARGVSFTTLVYGAASVAVLWMGVFAATKGVVGEGVVSTFSDSIKKIGGTVAKWPTYIPLSPVSGGMTISGLKTTAAELGSRLRQQQLDKDRKFADSVLGGYFPSGEIQSAMRRVVDSSKSGVVDTSGLNTISGTGVSTSQFGGVLKETVDNLKNNPTKLAEIANLAGYRGREQEFVRVIESGDTTKLAQIKSKINESTASTAPNTNTPVSYAGVTQSLGGIRNAATFQKNTIDSSMAKPETRQGLGLKLNQAGTEYEFDLSTTTPEAFMNTLKGSDVSDQTFQMMIGSGILYDIADKKEEMRERMKDDDTFKTRLSRAIDERNTAEGKGINKKIREVFKKVTGLSGNDIKEKGGPAGQRIARIDDTTGEYTAPTTP